MCTKMCTIMCTTFDNTQRTVCVQMKEKNLLFQCVERIFEGSFVRNFGAGEESRIWKNRQLNH
jgi:hypothetical protein